MSQSAGTASLLGDRYRGETIAHSASRSCSDDLALRHCRVSHLPALPDAAPIPFVLGHQGLYTPLPTQSAGVLLLAHKVLGPRSADAADAVPGVRLFGPGCNEPESWNF